MHKHTLLKCLPYYFITIPAYKNLSYINHIYNSHLIDHKIFWIDSSEICTKYYCNQGQRYKATSKMITLHAVILRFLALCSEITNTGPKSKINHYCYVYFNYMRKQSQRNKFKIIDLRNVGGNTQISSYCLAHEFTNQENK